MERTRDKQSGFNIVELLIIIVTVGVIGAGGWFVYQHNRVKITGAEAGTQTTNQGTNSTGTTPTTTVIKIPELGIQITVPDDIKDLTYRATTVTLRNKNQATIAYFSTTALTAVDANCDTNFGPLGTLGRANGQYPTQSEDPYYVLDYGQLVKQFPTFYITAGHSQAACSTAATAGSDTAAANNEALASKDEAAFTSSFSTIQPLN